MRSPMNTHHTKVREMLCCDSLCWIEYRKAILSPGHGGDDTVCIRSTWGSTSFCWFLIYNQHLICQYSVEETGAIGRKHGHRRLLVKPKFPDHSNFFTSHRSSLVLRTMGLRWRETFQQIPYARDLIANTFHASSHRRPREQYTQCTTMANRQLIYAAAKPYSSI
jgi:hypothetical protein